MMKNIEVMKMTLLYKHSKLFYLLFNNKEIISERNNFLKK